MLAGVCVATALFGVAAAVTFQLRGWNWVSIGMAAAVVLGFAGIVEALVERIVLEADTLMVRRLWGTRRYSIDEIDGGSEGRGAGGSPEGR